MNNQNLNKILRIISINSYVIGGDGSDKGIMYINNRSNNNARINRYAHFPAKDHVHR